MEYTFDELHRLLKLSSKTATMEYLIKLGNEGKLKSRWDWGVEGGIKLYTLQDNIRGMEQ